VRIALFAPYDLASHGGVASHIRAQGRALSQLGHAVRIFGPASKPLENGETALAGSTRVTFGGTASGAALSPSVFQRVAALYAAEPFDVVHVHEPLMPLLPWAAVWAATAPVVATFHVYRESGHRWYPLARPLLQTIVNRIDARIAVSEAARRTVESVFPGDYEIIPNGIEIARFQAKQPRPPVFPASGPVVVCVGRLEPRKGVDVLVAAMSRVQQVVDAALVLVGDGPERTTLEAHARQSSVRATVVRNVDDTTLPAFYQHATAVCAPATSGESFGIVLIEALAAGAPVVASRIDGYVDAVGESAGVRWAVPGDPDDLARQLIAVIAQRGSPIRDEVPSVATNFDWGRVARHLTDTYNRVQRPAAVAQT
jgi:phosphatidyl-myo-inositol alpha-mannosyltransferase